MNRKQKIKLLEDAVKESFGKMGITEIALEGGPTIKTKKPKKPRADLIVDGVTYKIGDKIESLWEDGKVASRFLLTHFERDFTSKAWTIYGTPVDGYECVPGSTHKSVSVSFCVDADGGNYYKRKLRKV